MIGEVGFEGLSEVLEDVARLPTAAFHRRQEGFDEPAAARALRAERRFPPDHGGTQGSFADVVGRFDALHFRERPQPVAVVVKLLAHSFEPRVAAEDPARHESDDSDGNQAVLARVTPAAKRRFVAFVNEQGREHHELSSELAAWSKLDSCAARLALVHLVCGHSEEPDNLEADEASIEAGFTLSRSFAHEALQLYAALAESDEDRERRELVELIGRTGGRITARGLMQSMPRCRESSDAAEEALQDLVDAGCGRWEVGPAATNKRRDFVLMDARRSHTFPGISEENANPLLLPREDEDRRGNLRTQLLRIIRRAGWNPWPKLFQNLRSTRQTELADEYPIQVVTAWIGNPAP